MRNWTEFSEGSVAETAGRKRKVEIGDSSLAVSSVQLKARPLATATTLQEPADSRESSGSSTCESVGSVLASCCSSLECRDSQVEGSSRFVDLKVSDEWSRELSATSAVDTRNCRDRREPAPSSSRPKYPLQKMPSEVELERFFAAAEKKLVEEFVDKYNYDIVKDKPLEGAYEWVEIKFD